MPPLLHSSNSGIRSARPLRWHWRRAWCLRRAPTRNCARRQSSLAFTWGSWVLVAWIGSLFIGHKVFLVIYGPAFVNGVPVMIYATGCSIATFFRCGPSPQWLVAARRYQLIMVKQAMDRGRDRRCSLCHAAPADDVLAVDGHSRIADPLLVRGFRQHPLPQGAIVKICLCGNRFPPNVVGGAEVIVHDLAVQLKDRGHQVSILTLSDTRSGSTSVVDGLGRAGSCRT